MKRRSCCWQLLEVQIQKFTSTAEMMIHEDHYDSPAIRLNVTELQRKWSQFHTTLGEHRMMLELNITFQELIEEV